MLRKLCVILGCGGIVCASIFALTVAISAQNTTFEYVIPHFTSNTGSELIISNLNGDTDTANPDVTLAGSGTGNVSEAIITVNPHSQLRLTAASFGLASFDGSVVVKSSVRLSVIATITGAGTFETVSAFEAKISAQNDVLGDSDVIIPFAPGKTGQMRLTVFNPNKGQTNAVITAVPPGGLASLATGGVLGGSNIGGGVQATIAGLGTFKQDISGDPRDIAYLLIHVPTSIFGVQSGVYAQAEMINFSDTGEGLPVPSPDFSAVTSVPVSAAMTTGIIPYFHQGGDFVTELQFVNTSTATGAIFLTAYDLQGNPVQGAQSVSVPPNGAARLNIQDVFDGAVTGEGSIVFNSTTPVIAAVAIANIRQGGFVVTPAAQQPGKDFVFSIRDSKPELFTQLSFLNSPGQAAANITLRYISDDGTPNSTATLTLDPSAPAMQMTATLSKFMPEAQKAGFIHVSSDQPIIATALEGVVDSSALAALPAMHSQSGYLPLDPGSYVFSGTITHNGKPLPGVTVLLSGPVNLSAVTDQNGAFLLLLKPVTLGDYTITPSATGYAFNPSSIPITVGGASGSSRNSTFTAALQKPAIVALQPNGIVTGSSATTLLVLGSFDNGQTISTLAPGGRIIFDGSPLTTTLATAPATGLPASVVIGTAQTVPALQATIPANALLQSHYASVVVQTTGPGGSVQSDPAPLQVGSAAPSLSAFGQLPTPVIAGSPAVTTTITGTGFIKGVSVLVSAVTNGVVRKLPDLTEGNGVTFQSSTSIQVTFPASDLAVPRVLKISTSNPAPTVGPSNTLDLPVVPVPAPVLTGFGQLPSPLIASRYGCCPSGLTTSINGTGFIQGVSVLTTAVSNGVSTALARLTEGNGVTFQSSTSIQVTFPADFVALPADLQVSTLNPGPTVGPSNSLDLPVLPVPAPVLTSFLSLPVPLLAGNPGFTATITGAGFIQGQGLTVQVGVLSGGLVNTLATLTQGTGLTFQSPTRLQVTIGGSLLATGRILKFSATNPGPTIGPSNALDLPVMNPIPVVTSISPDHANVVSEPNSPSLAPFVVSGFGFKPGAAITFGGTPITTTFNSSILLTGSIPQQLLNIGGVIPVTVTNPEPSVGPSTPVSFLISNLVPLLVSAEPVNGPLSFDSSRPNEIYPATLIARGSNFEPGVSAFEIIAICAPVVITPQTVTLHRNQSVQFTVYLNGTVQPIGTTAVTWAILQTINGVTTQINPPGNANVGYITTGGLYTAPIAIPNPSTLTIQATYVSGTPPNTTTTLAISTVTISDTLLGGSGAPSAGANVIGSHEAVLTTTITCAGTYQVNVKNPQPGGGISPLPTDPNQVRFVVVPYTQGNLPQITSFAPASITPATNPNDTDTFPLTINGTNFETSPGKSLVSFGNTVLVPTNVTSTLINVDVPKYLITEAGYVPVVVTNPDGINCGGSICGAGSSNRSLFPVFPSTAPTIISLSPPTAPINAPFTLTITGTNFETAPSLSIVLFNGTALQPRSVTATTITVNIPGYLINKHGPVPVVVVNPDTGSSNTMFPVF